MFIYAMDRTAGNYEEITVSTTAIGITDTLLRKGANSAEVAFMTLEGANIRFTVDGTTPTTTKGHQLVNGQNLTLSNSSDIGNFRAIRDNAVDATLRVTLRY